MSSSTPPTGVTRPSSPFELGKSPFRVKGQLYLATRSFFDANVAGGVDALVAEIQEPELREFITQKFLPGGWYDVLPAPALIAYEAKTLRMTQEEYLLHRSRHQAKTDLGGIHGWVIRLATPHMVAVRMPRIASQMFDFIRVEVIAEESGSTEHYLHGIPRTLVDWLSVSLRVYGETALKLAGAKKVTVHRPQVKLEGAVSGVRVVTLSFHSEWQ